MSEVFYEPELRLEHHYSGARAAERAPDFGLFQNRPVVWLDTADVLHNHEARGRQGIEWPCVETNAYEVDLIMTLLGKLDWDVLGNTSQRSVNFPSWD